MLNSETYRKRHCNGEVLRGIFDYDAGDSGETGKSLIYRKNYEPGNDAVIELKSLSGKLNPLFKTAVSASDLIETGANAEFISEFFSRTSKKLNAVDKEKLKLIDELWGISDDEEKSDKKHNSPSALAISLLRLDVSEIFH